MELERSAPPDTGSTCHSLISSADGHIRMFLPRLRHKLEGESLPAASTELRRCAFDGEGGGIANFGETPATCLASCIMHHASYLATCRFGITIHLRATATSINDHGRVYFWIETRPLCRDPTSMNIWRGRRGCKSAWCGFSSSLNLCGRPRRRESL